MMKIKIMLHVKPSLKKELVISFERSYGAWNEIANYLTEVEFLEL